MKSTIKAYSINNYKTLDYLLAFHCSPTIAGIKASNLLTIKKEDYFQSNSLNQLKEKKIHHFILKETKDNLLILVYNQIKLLHTIQQKSAKRFLERNGYCIHDSLESILQKLSYRIQECSSKDEYPHEIGIFLGYPVGDIAGFIHFKGCHYKLSGYWKVYSNPSRAKKLFEAYDMVKEFYCAKIASGQKIYQINDGGIVA